jgi:hypothetical protein
VSSVFASRKTRRRLGYATARTSVTSGSEDAARAPHHLLAGRCEQHAPPVALEERDAEHALEVLDLRAQRGLRHRATLRGPTESQGIGHRHDVLQLPQR